MLTSFSVENYRSFARKQNIELRPLTLFFGWNSGGKSALLRFLPLISESVHVGGPPIWLGGNVGRRATWPALVCKATGRSAMGFSLKWNSDSSLASDWKIGGDSEGTYQEIEALEIDGNAQDRALCNWAGLLPSELIGTSLPNNLHTLRLNLLDLRNEVQWISGVRTRPARIVTYGGGAAGTLNADGSDAVDHLIAAQLRSSADPVLEATRSFFLAMGEQLILDNSIAGVWRVLLHPTGGPQVRVDLCDTGEGYSQVLPVLVALARAKNGGPRLLCLEQPELHLHTRAQAELAKQLVATANSDKEPRLLVETHSEVLLTSIQLAIAEGVLAPELVRVYWIETRPDGTSDAVPVGFNSQGRPDSSTLAGAFGEAVRLGQELLSMQLSKSKR
jgi:hypothetical protein